jgi:serine/threonine protein phosphatase PrpC
MAFSGGLLPKYGQDAIRTLKNSCALADGHGLEGTEFATNACNEFFNFVQKTDSDPSETMKGLDDLFLYLHESHKYRQGGTTLTCLILKENYLICSNVGDSDAFLFTLKNGKYHTLKLTQTHEPCCLSEYLRIKEKGLAECTYETICNQSLPIFDKDDNEIIYEKTYEKYQDSVKAWQQAHKDYKEATPETKQSKKEFLDKIVKDSKEKKVEYQSSLDGKRLVSTARGDRACYVVCNDVKLAVTRSIGDYNAHKVGVIANPSSTLYSLDELDMGEKAVLFVASDGVLDCFEYEDLSQLVLTIEDDRELILEFQKRSVSLFGKQHDDISFLRKLLH